MGRQQPSVVSMVTIGFNLLFMGCGGSLIALGVAVKMKIKEVHLFPGSEIGPTAELVIAIGGIILLISFLGCCGAMMNSQCMLTMFACILSLLFILEICVGFLTYVYKNKLEQTFASILRSSSLDQTKMDSNRYELWQFIQSKLECCGYDADRTWIREELPPSCCKNETTVKPDIDKTVPGHPLDQYPQGPPPPRYPQPPPRYPQPPPPRYPQPPRRYPPFGHPGKPSHGYPPLGHPQWPPPPKYPQPYPLSHPPGVDPEQSSGDSTNVHPLDEVSSPETSPDTNTEWSLLELSIVKREIIQNVERNQLVPLICFRISSTKSCQTSTEKIAFSEYLKQTYPRVPQRPSFGNLKMSEIWQPPDIPQGPTPGYPQPSPPDPMPDGYPQPPSHGYPQTVPSEYSQSPPIGHPPGEYPQGPPTGFPHGIGPFSGQPPGGYARPPIEKPTRKAPLPLYCNEMNPSKHQVGCLDALKQKITKNLGMIAIVAIITIFIQLLGATFGCCLAFQSRKRREQFKEGRGQMLPARIIIQTQIPLQ